MKIKEKFKRVSGYKNYAISNMGYVINKNTGRILKPFKLEKGRQFYVHLNKSNTSKPFNLARLVLTHFTKKELGKNFAIHLNRLTSDNRVNNLKSSTRGDLIRWYNQEKKRPRGIYKNTLGSKPFRVLIKYNNKAKTVGYFKHRSDAEVAYRQEYVRFYGQEPY